MVSLRAVRILRDLLEILPARRVRERRTLRSLHDRARQVIAGPSDGAAPTVEHIAVSIVSEAPAVRRGRHRMLSHRMAGVGADIAPLGDVAHRIECDVEILGAVEIGIIQPVQRVVDNGNSL